MSKNVFINSTMDTPEPNAESRRKIRSQAMRDFRRRQRVEGETEASSPEDSPSSLSSPPQSSASGSRRESRHESQNRESNTPSLPPPSGSLRRPSSGRSREDLPPIEDLSFAKGKHRSPQSVLHDESRSESPRNKKRIEEPRAQHGTFGSFTINLPSTNSSPPSTSEAIDSLSSPGQLEHLLVICETYNRWLASNTASETEPSIAQARDPLSSRTSPMLLFALCLKSIGHLDVVNPSNYGCNRQLLKTRVLALANQCLKSPATALEDNTIGALACLTSYEISRGSSEATMHLTGLSQIIKLRGGVDKISNKGGLYMFLEMLDLIHAICFQASPMYASADKSRPVSNACTPHLQPFDIGMDLDQQTLEDLSNFIMAIPEMGTLTGNVSDPLELQPEPIIPAPSFESEVDKWHQFLVQAAQSIAPSFNGSLAYACGLAASLHGITTSAIAPHPMRLQTQSDGLFNAMKDLPDNAWEAFQMLHVRILLTALSSTPNLSQKAWYNAHLTRRLYQLELENWSQAKGLMLQFIDMQAMARRPQTRAVRAVVNGIEIVVDSFEARENGWDIAGGIGGPDLDGAAADVNTYVDAGPAGSSFRLDPRLE